MKVLAIAGVNLRRMLRDRSTIVFVLIFPLLIITVVGTATGGFNDDEVPLGVVDAGSGDLGSALTDSFDASATVDVVAFDDGDQLRRAIRRGSVVAGVVIPEGYEDRLSSGDAAVVEFVSDPARGFPSAVRTIVSTAVADQGGRFGAARFASDQADVDIEQGLAATDAAAEILQPAGVTVSSVGGNDDGTDDDDVVIGIPYQAASNIVLFVFITSLAASGMLIESRRLGISRRMFGTPTRTSSIIAGEALGRFAIGAFQALFILVAGIVVFGVDYGDPFAVAVLMLLFVLVGTSVAMLLGSVVRTPEQAGSIGPPVGIAMGMLAGCMWPRFIMPEFMQRIGQAFPHAWAMDAWIDLISFDATIGDIGMELAVLAGYAAVLLPLAVWRIRRSLAG